MTEHVRKAARASRRSGGGGGATASVEAVEQRLLFAVGIYNVTTTADAATSPPVGSLRWAIQQANAHMNEDGEDGDGVPDPDEIRFVIPGTGTRTISPVAPLDAITEAVTIDAIHDQPGWVPDDGTVPPETAEVPVIELNGSQAGANANGLTINANETTVLGLAINRFSRHGIAVTGNGNNLFLNNLGTSPTTTSFTVSGRPGLLARPNGGDGVRIAGDDNLLGNNVIAYNGGAGVSVTSGGGNDVGINSIFQNVGEGIDLGADGRTANDALDADAGPNGRLNYPVLSAPTVSAAGVTVTGSIDTSANTEVFVTIYANPTNEREGRVLPVPVVVSLDATDPNNVVAADGRVLTNAAGHGTFSYTFDDPAESPSGYLTAVATAFAPSTAIHFFDTSEFSEPVPLAGTIVPHVSAVYVNGAGGTGLAAWSTAFRGFLQTQGVGDPTLGYQITSALQLRSVPWTNVNQVSIRFDTDVTVKQSDLQVITRTSPGTDSTAAFAATNGFSYNPTTHVATWTLAAALPMAKVLLNLDGDAGGVSSPSSGLLLDGDWSNPTSPSAPAANRPFPSGDGAAGGDFRFRFNSIPGDVNFSTGVTITDTGAVKARQGAVAAPDTPIPYSVFLDVNGSGGITITDTGAVKARQGLTITTIDGDPAGTTTASALFGAASIADQLTDDGVL